MKRLLTTLLVSALLPAAGQAPLFSEIGAMEQSLAQITGLRFMRDVPYAVIDKNQLRIFLELRMKEAVKPAELRAEELTLKMLGLIPQDFDLRQSTVDLLTEQAAAFYDYNKKKLFVLAGTGATERVTAVMLRQVSRTHHPPRRCADCGGLQIRPPLLTDKVGDLRGSQVRRFLENGCDHGCDRGQVGRLVLAACVYGVCRRIRQWLQ